MLQIAGYRLPFHSTHVVCPVCTSASGNPCSISVQPVQPCCFYPAEICPELPVQLPGSSVMALPPSSFRPYGIAVKPRNSLPVSYRHIQPLQNENTTRSQAEGNDGISGVTSNSDSTEVSKPHRCTAAAGTKRKRRKRTIFTSEQLTRLESEFEEQQYMVGTERQQLAEALNLSETQIKIWFQNRRIKWRKENKQNYPDFLASPFAVACAFRHAEESWNDQCGLRSCNDCQEK